MVERILTVVRLVFLLLMMSWIVVGCRQVKTADPPNVLMISIDDLNTWIGCMGARGVLTPNIDRLASRGILFTNAHCQAPLCGPSRASVLTGLRPSTTGIYGQIKDQDLRKASSLTREIPFLPQYFREHGYYTMGVGKIFHQHAPEGMFDESGGREKGFGPKPPGGKFFAWNQEGTSTDWGAYPEQDRAMPDYRSAQWAMERLGRTYKQPFFMAVGFVRPHVPWYVPQAWFDQYDTGQIMLPPYLETDMDDVPDIAREIDRMPMYPSTEWAIEQGEWKNIVQAYQACITFVDHYVGELMDALDNSPHADNTIIILWSDHGYRLGEKGKFAKQCLWNEATQVPLMISGPGMPENKIVDVPTELLSIFPTLVELCDLPPNPHNEGQSLVPLIHGDTTAWDHPAITTYGRNNHAVVHGNYRYIRYEDGSEELYNREMDPNEWVNLTGDMSAQNVVATRDRMKKMLPEPNLEWSTFSAYKINNYFRRTSGELRK